MEFCFSLVKKLVRPKPEQLHWFRRPCSLKRKFIMSNPVKICGPDGIPSLLLLKSAQHISSPLSILFINLFPLVNLYLTGSLQMWFQYIKSDKSVPTNYRPISLTSIIVKVVERLIYYRLVPLLEDSGRLNDYQYDFLPKCSTVIILLEAVHSWAQAFGITFLYPLFVPGFL